jgi:hypothetical protein
MWSIQEQSGEVYDLVNSVVLAKMLHMGLACNMLRAIGQEEIGLWSSGWPRRPSGTT